ncbi:MAG: hypothetical protein M8357_02820 [Desulfobulbaceae bacterium]|nr:hypothetical protein [Desulfobulbaceae bacterium]
MIDGFLSQGRKAKKHKSPTRYKLSFDGNQKNFFIVKDINRHNPSITWREKYIRND